MAEAVLTCTHNLYFERTPRKTTWHTRKQNLACLTCGQSGARTHTRHSGEKKQRSLPLGHGVRCILFWELMRHVQGHNTVSPVQEKNLRKKFRLNSKHSNQNPFERRIFLNKLLKLLLEQFDVLDETRK